MLKIICATLLVINTLALSAFCIVLGPAVSSAWLVSLVFGIIFSVIGLACSIEFEERREKRN